MQYAAGSDRREFFRINDTVVIDYKNIEKDQIEAVIKRISQSIDDDDSSSGKAQLRVLQSAFSHLVDQINLQDRDTARALRMLDDKINIIAQNLQRQYNFMPTDTLIEANISGGGISFQIPQVFEVRDAVELHLQLLPSANIIHALATVISCDRLMGAPEDKPYNLRMAFTHMDEQDRNLLIKHTLNRQAEMLRGGLTQGMSLREF